MIGYNLSCFQPNLNTNAADTLKPGRNRMVVHCHHSGGGQYLDVRMVSPRAEKLLRR
jgi:hypothetical protein